MRALYCCHICWWHYNLWSKMDYCLLMRWLRLVNLVNQSCSPLVPLSKSAPSCLNSVFCKMTSNLVGNQLKFLWGRHVLYAATFANLEKKWFPAHIMSVVASGYFVLIQLWKLWKIVRTTPSFINNLAANVFQSLLSSVQKWLSSFSQQKNSFQYLPLNGRKKYFLSFKCVFV